LIGRGDPDARRYLPRDASNHDYEVRVDMEEDLLVRLASDPVDALAVNDDALAGEWLAGGYGHTFGPHRARRAARTHAG
jgi:hypothetical protein